MEPPDFREFFIYNHKVRQEYISSFKRTLTWQDMTANHETAWLSLKDTLLHIIWAEDTWINHSIQDPLIILNIRHGIQLKNITQKSRQKSINFFLV